MKMLVLLSTPLPIQQKTSRLRMRKKAGHKNGFKKIQVKEDAMINTSLVDYL